MSRLICRMLIVFAALVELLVGSGGCSKPAANVAAPTTMATTATTRAAPDSSAPQVTIDNFAFGPQSLTISPGTKVTWVNHDDVPHTVTSSDSPPKFKSPALDTDDKFSHVFTEPGTYPYFCAVHPKMTGQVVVK